MGDQAVLGATNRPYPREAKDMRLNEMPVARGAPLKPRRIGSGPQTVEPNGNDERTGETSLKPGTYRGGSLKPR
jgi:hypothetical protein